jgi:hypothetical protein
MRLLVPSIAVATLLVSASSFADDAACLAAASKGQKLRNAHQLVEARDQLRVCAAAGCPGVVQSDCVTWLAEVDKQVPGAVAAAKNGSGVDLVDVKVTVDGKPFAAKLDGQALPIDAGAHTFHFEAPDGTSVDRQVIIKEGDKAQEVSVVLGAPAQSPSTSPGAVSAVAPEKSSTWRTAGWVLGGAGVVGLALGTVFGIVALSDKSSANCVNDVCNPGTLGGMKTMSAVSTTGFVAGGVFLAGGVGLILFAPKGSPDSAPPSAGAGVRVAPMVTANGGSLVAVGVF